MSIFLQTSRLLIRMVNDNDLDDLYRLNSDREVMKYIGDGAPNTIEDTKAGLERIKIYYNKYPGLGVWALEDKSSKEFIGLCMLKYWGDTREIEVGYRLLKRYWRKGYAYESAEALVKYGREKLCVKRIIGIAQAGNVSSIKVLEKLGMRFEKVETKEGRSNNFYALEF